MLFDKVVVAGLAHVDAPHRVPSTVFEDRLAGTMARLGMRSDILRALAGIEARRWWDEGVEPDEAAALAGEKVIERAGIDRNRIGVIFNTSVCRAYLEPSTACMVHGRLGLPSTCLNYDLGNACLAFLNAMELAGTLLERGAMDYALIVDGEGSRSIQEVTLDRLAGPDATAEDFRAEFATLTLGSGAVAMLLSRSDLHPDAPRYRGGVSRAATEWSHLCRGKHDRMTTDTATLLRQGVGLAMQTWAVAQETLGWNNDALDHLVLHQVSAVHTHKLCKTLGLDPQKAILTFPELGNIDEGAGPPIVMVHGNPTWSFYYREVVKAFRETHRCIVLDHIGCGLSDKPKDDAYTYTLGQRVDDLEALVAHLDLGPLTLMVHDWGGAIGMGWATRHHAQVERLVLLNTAAFHNPRGLKIPPSLKLVRDTGLGALLVRGFNAFSAGATRMAVTRPLPADVRKAYTAPYDSWGNRIATLRFVQDIPLTETDPAHAVISATEAGLEHFVHTPTLICWGEKDFVFDAPFLAEWERRLPHAEVHRFPDGGHYILEDERDAVLDHMRRFFGEHPVSGDADGRAEASA